MSFSVEYTAATKAGAHRELNLKALPPLVAELIYHAIEHAHVDPAQHLHVKAQGHLSSGGLYETSYVTIEVRPLAHVQQSPEQPPAEPPSKQPDAAV